MADNKTKDKNIAVPSKGSLSEKDKKAHRLIVIVAFVVTILLLTTLTLAAI